MIVPNQSAIGGPQPNEMTLRTNSNEYNEGTRTMQLIHEVHNSARNFPVIMDALATGRARDISEEPKATGAAFIIGSGPSLDDTIEHLKGWKGGIICTTSHALTLMYHGIEPTHIIALDPFSMWDEIGGVDWSQTRTKLIAHPGVWPDLIGTWPNEILLYRQQSGQQTAFYHETQSHMYTERDTSKDTRRAKFEPLIKTEITIFACSPPLQMFAGIVLGYSRFFLAGVDFAFHSGKERFTSYTVSKPAKTVTPGNTPPVTVPAEWETHEHPLNPEGRTLINTANGMQSEQTHLYYKKNFLSAWRLSLADAYVVGKGAITEMPVAPIEKVIRSQGTWPKIPKFTHQQIVDSSETYLAKLGAYIIDGNPGLWFVESAHPYVELVSFMASKLKQYVCPKCSLHAEAPNLENLDQPCPRCGDKLQRASNLDIGANLKRLIKLIDG